MNRNGLAKMASGLSAVSLVVALAACGGSGSGGPVGAVAHAPAAQTRAHTAAPSTAAAAPTDRHEQFQHRRISPIGRTKLPQRDYRL